MMNGYTFKIFHCSELKATAVFKFSCDYDVKKWEANLDKVPKLLIIVSHAIYLSVLWFWY